LSALKGLKRGKFWVWGFLGIWGIVFWFVGNRKKDVWIVRDPAGENFRLFYGIALTCRVIFSSDDGYPYFGG